MWVIWDKYGVVGLINYLSAFALPCDCERHIPSKFIIIEQHACACSHSLLHTLQLYKDFWVNHCESELKVWYSPGPFRFWAVLGSSCSHVWSETFASSISLANNQQWIWYDYSIQSWCFQYISAHSSSKTPILKLSSQCPSTQFARRFLPSSLNPLPQVISFYPAELHELPHIFL